jgi:hypothetical protein
MGGKTGTAILIEIKENPQKRIQTTLARTAFFRREFGALEDIFSGMDVMVSKKVFFV